MNSPLSEENIIPSWRNTIEHLLLEYMVESPVCTAVLTDIITSNLISHIVVRFILDPKLLKTQYYTKETTKEPERILEF